MKILMETFTYREVYFWLIHFNAIYILVDAV